MIKSPPFRGIEVSVSVFLRSMGTLLLFALFFLASLAAGCASLLLRLVFRRDRRKAELITRRLARAALRLLVRLAGLLRVFRVRAEGALPAEGVSGLVIAANHPALTDYMVLAQILPADMACVVSGRLLRGVMGMVISGMGYIGNDLPPEEWKGRINPADAILIFPEGTRSAHHGWQVSLKRGAANLSLRLGRDILPVCIICTVRGYLGTGFLSLRAPDEVPVFTVRFGKIISPEPFLGEGVPVPLAARSLTSYLERLFAEETGAEAAPHGTGQDINASSGGSPRESQE